MKKVLYFLGQLNDRDVDWILKIGRRTQIKANETLITEGRHSDHICILLDGRLSVSLANNETIASLKSGEIVGELSFVDSRPPSATVTAVEDSDVLMIDKRELDKRLETDSAFSGRFYKALAVFLADRLRDTVQAFGYKDVKSLSEEHVLADEADLNFLDNAALAGERFQRLVKESAA